jgi:hypothetical protein
LDRSACSAITLIKGRRYDCLYRRLKKARLWFFEVTGRMVVIDLMSFVRITGPPDAQTIKVSEDGGHRANKWLFISKSMAILGCLPWSPRLGRSVCGTEAQRVAQQDKFLAERRTLPHTTARCTPIRSERLLRLEFFTSAWAFPVEHPISFASFAIPPSNVPFR